MSVQSCIPICVDAAAPPDWSRLLVLNPVDPGKSETNRSSLRYGLSVSNQGEDKDRVAFPALSSVLDEQALLNRVVCHYDLPHPARECQFFDRGDSDIYRVRTEHAAFYLKVYRPPYAAEQVEQEAQRVHDLRSLGFLWSNQSLRRMDAS